MGGSQSCCSSRTKDKDETFDKRDLALLFEVLTYYSEQGTDTKGSGKLNQKSFEKMFHDIPQLGIKFFKYCISFASDSHWITIEELTPLIHPFLKSLTTNLGPFELFCLVVMERNGPTGRTIKELDRVYVTLDQGYQVISFVVQIFLTSHKRTGQFDSRPVKAFVDGVFNGEKTLKYTYFVRECERQLPYVNQLIRSYLQNKFLSSPFSVMKVPRMMQESYVVGREWLALLALTHGDLNSSESMQLAYSSAKQTFTFDAFATALMAAGDKTLILLIYEEVQDQLQISNPRQRFAFAGYNRHPWTSRSEEVEFTEDQMVYQLSPACQVFSNQVLRQRNVYDDSEFPTFYFNFKRNKQALSGEEKLGLGMGKDVFTQNYLFWIDQDLVHQSYCVRYHAGDSESYLIKPFSLLMIEIWKYGMLEPKIENMPQRLTLTSEQRTNTPLLKERQTWTSAKSLDGSPMLRKKKNLRVRFQDSPEVQTPQGGQKEETPPLKPSNFKLQNQTSIESPSSPCFGKDEHPRDSRSVVEKYSKPEQVRLSQRRSVDDIIKSYRDRKQK